MQALSNHMPADSETVKVVVRCRPLNSTEIQDGRTQIVQMDGRMGTVSVTVPKSAEPPKSFTFDAVYPPNTAQEFIYQGTAKPILDSVMQARIAEAQARSRLVQLQHSF